MPHREDRFTVNAFDCRPDGRMKPNALMQCLQEAAARHAEQLGVGFADLDRKNCFWVLANVKIQIASMPRWRDEMMIRTWPSGCTRIAASREFLGADPDGHELFRAASEWMILDKHTGRLRNLLRLDLHLPPDGPRVLPADLHRLAPGDGFTKAGALRVPFSALDFNGHVNNTEYVRWGLDGLHRSRHNVPMLRSIQATYLAEVFEGDEIEVLVAHDSESRVRILERKPDAPTGTNVFLMEILC
jgi:medium-chain acyl-[acyl-carrier-protein] hydrolase